MAAPRDFVNRLFHELAGAGKQSWRYALAAALAANLFAFAPAVSVAQQNAPQNAPAVTQPAPPQNQPAAQGSQKLTRGEQRNFNRYLEAHPKLAKQLQRDPSLANNADFLAKHKGFQDYLNKHPKIMAQLRQDPQALMQHYAWYQKHERWHGMHKKA